MENSEILNKLEKIDKNTTQTLQVLSKESEELKTKKIEFDEKIEKRKEQNRESQKKFKTIGFKGREEVYFEYEKFAKEEMGSSSLSAFLKSFSTLLFENRDFQKLFKEFQILQKNDEKHHQVSFFSPKSEFDKLEKMAADEGFTLANLTKQVMFQLLLNKELRDQVISKIKLD